MNSPKDNPPLKDSPSIPEDMPEETSHPAARMTTLNNPFFWIFFVGCLALYVYNRVNGPLGIDQAMGYKQNNSLICIVAFIGLFINLGAGMVKRMDVSRLFVLSGYAFEIISFAFLAYRIFGA